jgi:hypothetical protein
MVCHTTPATGKLVIIPRRTIFLLLSGVSHPPANEP